MAYRQVFAKKTLKNGHFLPISARFGYIDEKGKVVIEPQFDDAHLFNEGLVAIKIDGEWGFIDKDGHYVINPQFKFTFDFTYGLAAVPYKGHHG